VFFDNTKGDPLASNPSPAGDMNVEKYAGLVRSCAYTLKGKYALDDVTQEGFIGLMRAHRTHDPSRIPYLLHASIVVRNAIIDALRRWDRGPQGVAIGDVPDRESEPQLDYEDLLGSLPVPQGEILYRRYWQRERTPDIAKDLGMSRQHVNRLSRLALDSLRQKLE
jgi:RNA polymerase sigma factor (sigma-70 family)